VKPSNQPGKLYDVVTTAEGSVNYRLGSRFLVVGGVKIDDLKSNTDPLPVVPVLTKARHNTVYTSVRYLRSSGNSLLLDVRRETRKTNLPAYDYTNVRVGLTANVNF
jgi:hypothetical protein